MAQRVVSVAAELIRDAAGSGHCWSFRKFVTVGDDAVEKMGAESGKLA
jgi:hypothetical protein